MESDYSVSSLSEKVSTERERELDNKQIDIIIILIDDTSNCREDLRRAKPRETGVKIDIHQLHVKNKKLSTWLTKAHETRTNNNLW